MYNNNFGYKQVKDLEALTTVVSKENYNLSKPEKKLLRLHQQLAQLDFNKVKFLFLTEVLARSKASRSLQTAASDNGPAFASKEFERHMKQFEAISKFADAGAHHHNGVAEQSIRKLISIAHTMMMHSAVHWPNVSDPSLWPMAVMYAAHVCNRVPNIDTGVCPLDLIGSKCNFMTCMCVDVQCMCYILPP